MTPTGHVIKQVDAICADAEALLRLPEMQLARATARAMAIIADTSRNPDHLDTRDPALSMDFPIERKVHHDLCQRDFCTQDREAELEDAS